MSTLPEWAGVRDNPTEGPGERVFGYAHNEVQLVYDTLRVLKPDLICEWGTNVGSSARLFWEFVDSLNLTCPIHSVEISDNVHGGRGKHVEGLPVTLHLGDGLTTALDLVDALEPERPLFFLDDSHVYESVLEQLEIIAACAPDVVLLLHDVFTVDMLSNLMLHEPGEAVRAFSARDRYDIVSVCAGGAMMRLWPK